MTYQLAFFTRRISVHRMKLDVGRTVWEDHQILNRIIRPISINMMNVFCWKEFTSEMLLHIPTMFLDILFSFFIVNKYIPIRTHKFSFILPLQSFLRNIRIHPSFSSFNQCLMSFSPPIWNTFSFLKCQFCSLRAFATNLFGEPSSLVAFSDMLLVFFRERFSFIGMTFYKERNSIVSRFIRSPFSSMLSAPTGTEDCFAQVFYHINDYNVVFNKNQGFGGI